MKLSIVDSSASFLCPGCGDYHTVTISGSHAWGWNGSVDAPTFTPSILVQSGHFSPWYKQGSPCWCTFNETAAEPSSFVCHRCHSYVTDGKIQFLADSTHRLAGQTVDIPEWVEW